MIGPARFFVGAILCLVASGCSKPSDQAQVEQKERDLLAPLKTTYSDQVMGYDIKETTLDISIDANAVLSMDADAEDAMKGRALRDWKSTWVATHPGQHATVRVRMIDFRGTNYADESAKV